MPSDDHKPSQSESSDPPSSSSWKHRIGFPTLVAGFAGAGAGLASKHRKVVGLPASASTYAANFAIVTACYCGAREYVGITRKTGPDDLLNSAIAGFGTGAILGRLYGGPVAAVRYSVLFTIAGTLVDYATIKLRPVLKSYKESMLGSNDGSKKNDGWLKLPDWSPIKVLDEEALAAKQAREKQ
ncbi:uncharacterized protein LOC126783439 [Argentina anserina]|uniref:uncharacterized protein LOC126783439 n=1 Tax=Argentina anserina TaxID=57926 RepID=UPI002176311A|nr:uncharacterized protein LOC126783439 [Potentilla anserina]